MKTPPLKERKEVKCFCGAVFRNEVDLHVHQDIVAHWSKESTIQSEKLLNPKTV